MKTAPLFDCHAHPELFGIEEWELVVQAAVARGVQGCLSAGIWWDRFEAFLSSHRRWIVERIVAREKFCALFHPKDSFPILSSLGLHPQEIALRWRDAGGQFNLPQAESDCVALKRIALAHSDFVWAIGETGFDLAAETLVGWSGKEELLAAQQYAFQKCVEIAQELSVPLIIHSRSAWGHTREQLQNFKQMRSQPFMIHCYPGSRDDTHWLHQLGGFASFGGVLTWARAKRMQEALTSLPESCLLFETDSPDLPVEFADGLRAQRSEPHHLKDVFLKAELLRQVPIQSLADVNFRNLMSLMSIH